MFWNIIYNAIQPQWALSKRWVVEVQGNAKMLVISLAACVPTTQADSAETYMKEILYYTVPLNIAS